MTVLFLSSIKHKHIRLDKHYKHIMLDKVLQAYKEGW